MQGVWPQCRAADVTAVTNFPISDGLEDIAAGPLSTHWPGEVPAAIMRQLCGVIEENSDGTAGLYKNPGRPGIAFGVCQKPPAVEVTPSALPITLAVIVAMAFTVAILAWNGYCLDVVRRWGRYQ